MSENNIQENEIAIENAVQKEIKPSFLKHLLSKVTDEIIIGLISTAILFLLNAALKLGGYLITQKISMLFIIFVIVSILYISIFESVYDGKTIGKKILQL